MTTLYRVKSKKAVSMYNEVFSAMDDDPLRDYFMEASYKRFNSEEEAMAYAKFLNNKAHKELPESLRRSMEEVQTSDKIQRPAKRLRALRFALSRVYLVDFTQFVRPFTPPVNGVHQESV